MSFKHNQIQKHYIWVCRLNTSNPETLHLSMSFKHKSEHVKVQCIGSMNSDIWFCYVSVHFLRTFFIDVVHLYLVCVHMLHEHIFVWNRVIAFSYSVIASGWLINIRDKHYITCLSYRYLFTRRFGYSTHIRNTFYFQFKPTQL